MTDIALDDSSGGDASPILKNQRISDVAYAMLIDSPFTRDRLDINTQQPKPHPTRPGRNQQECVLKLMALPGTTMEARIGGEGHVPEAGEVVRRIMHGGEWAQWIEAVKALPAHPGGTIGKGKIAVGDIVTFTVTHGQAYSMGKPSGQPMTTQAEVDAHRATGEKPGMYGDLTIRRATAEEAAWVDKAKAAHLATKGGVALDDGTNPEAHASFTGAATTGFGQPPAEAPF